MCASFIDFVDSIIAKFGSGGGKNAVHVSLSVGGLLEVIKIDPDSNKIVKYGNRTVEYNDSAKEIKDYAAFRDTLVDLFKELNIPSKSKIYLSLPTVHVGKTELPSMLSNESIGEALISEAGQNYIFRRNEPVISWFDISEYPDSENKTILYSALQRQALEHLQDVLSDAGMTIVGIEPAIISTLRALKHLNKISDQINNNKIWALMKISATGYSLSTMYGEKLIDYYKEPLALQTYEGEEIYETIYASLQIALMNTQSNNLFIVSGTDMVSAENMSTRVPIDGEVIFLENNRFRRQNFMDADESISEETLDKLSLEAIGVGLQGISDYLVTLDFLKSSDSDDEAFVFTFADKEIVVNELFLKRCIVISVMALVLPSLLLLLVSSVLDKNKNSQLTQLQAQVKEITQEVDKYKKIEEGNKGKFDENAEIERVLADNLAKIKAYSAIGESVPKNLWLTYFMTKNNGKMDITGVSVDVEDVYIFYRNMKDYLLDSKLKLRKLKMESGSVEEALASASNYSFEITNMTEEELNPPTEDDKKAADAKGGKKGARAKGGASAAKPGAAASKSAGGKGRNVKDLEEVEVH